MKSKFKKIGVLMGGPSEEREISFQSGKAVSNVLKKNDEDIVEIIIPKCKFRKQDELKKKIYKIFSKINIDIGFIALHGWFGEDGQVQSILDDLQIPYTGSGPVACMKALNKVTSRSIFKKFDIPVPDYEILDSNYNISNVNILTNHKFPLVVKPSNQGSSIGLSIVKNLNELDAAIKKALKYDSCVIIEEYLSGKELTAGILGDEVLPIIEIIPKEKFYNFKAKYKDVTTEYIVPAKLSQRLENIIRDISFKAHYSLGCSGFSRVDIKLDKNGYPRVLEVNTIPGLTAKSLLPKAAKAAGISFYDLCKIILGYAKNNFGIERGTIYVKKKEIKKE